MKETVGFIGLGGMGMAMAVTSNGHVVAAAPTASRHVALPWHFLVSL